MWLQAKKENSQGLSNTIVILASKASIGTDAISSFAEQVNKYREQCAGDTSKLDDLSLVFASNALSSDEIQRSTTDEDEFSSLIARKIENIKQDQAQRDYERTQLQKDNIAAITANSELALKVQTMEGKLAEANLQKKKQSMKHDLKELQQTAENYKFQKNQIQELISFSNKQMLPSARFVLVSLLLGLGILLVVTGYFAYPSIYNWTKTTTDWSNMLLTVVSSGLIMIIATPIYYIIIIFLFGTPYEPAQFFNHLRGIVIQRKLEKYILSNSFPSEYSRINLQFQLHQIDAEYLSVQDHIKILEQRLNETYI